MFLLPECNQSCILIVSVFLSPESTIPLSGSGVFYVLQQTLDLLFGILRLAPDRDRISTDRIWLDLDFHIVTHNAEMTVSDRFLISQAFQKVDQLS